MIQDVGSGETEMPNPLGSIIPILDLLGKELKILPATGGAVEDLQHPDQDEIEDALINKDTAEITAFAEVPEPDISDIYKPTPPLFRQEKHLFKFLHGYRSFTSWLPALRINRG